MGEGIKTSCQFPPIPIRDYDWMAYRDPEGPHGFGATEAEAIRDFIENYDEPDFRRDESLRPKRVLTKAEITGYRNNDLLDPIWTYVNNTLERVGQGWRETPVNSGETNGSA